MIPALVEASDSSLGVLPPGRHDTTLREFKEAFIYDEQRQWLFEGFLSACFELRQAGCKRIYVGGSIVTSKQYPSDWDACWDPAGVSAARLDPILYEDYLEQQRYAKFRGDLLIGKARDITNCPNYAKLAYARDGTPRGVIAMNLELIEILNI